MQDIQQQIAREQSILKSSEARRGQAQGALNSVKSEYVVKKQKKENGHCARRFSNRGKRRNCQHILDSQVGNLLNSIGIYQGKIDSENANIKSSQLKIKILQEEQESINKVAETLSKQGKDHRSNLLLTGAKSDAIKRQTEITAKAQADAIIAKAKNEAEIAKKEAPKNEALKRKQKTLMIILGAGLGVILLIAIGLKLIKKKK